MKTAHRIVLNALAASVMVFGLGSAFAETVDEAAALKKLEDAVTKSGTVTKSHKPSKRSIIFDQDEAAAAGTKQDCANLPADAPTTAVDFVINFTSGSAALAPSSVATVTNIAKILALSPERCVLVEGHTDAIGNADRNLALSKARAESVVNYIAQKSNLDRAHLVPVGKGSTDPLANLDPRDGKNRRVVFKVVAN